MKRVVKITNPIGSEEKYILREEYNNFGIYNQKTPNGYFVHQDWLIMTEDVILVIQSYNNVCKEEILDMIDNYNETKQFGVKALKKEYGLVMHPSGTYV